MGLQLESVAIVQGFGFERLARLAPLLGGLQEPPHGPLRHRDRPVPRSGEGGVPEPGGGSVRGRHGVLLAAGGRRRGGHPDGPLRQAGQDLLGAQPRPRVIHFGLDFDEKS